MAKNAKEVAQELCDDGNQMRYVLTALATAVQERLGEDIILCPRLHEKESVSAKAAVLSLRFKRIDQILWRHYIYYGIPEGDPPVRKELLRVTLDVAHELGHLILDRGPGRINMRVGMSKEDMADATEVEADWFALCILQMYGFVSPEKL